ncbi:alkaline phosphatase family protein [Novosphingobium sp. B 225]|uniref:alkaline phosphatase family protein n=1 Tax=Novosphingobium sp. B 225 TaxID=1961849 RepID=UPI000B4B9A47|nr:alkaline phosphatase family protein [Novosphingobium sp. B 225]
MSDPTPTRPDMHVFVLMLENRSFDHLFGMQTFTGQDLTGNPTQINGLKPLPANFQNSYNGKSYPPQGRAVDPMLTDPGHEFPDTLEQLTGSKYNPLVIEGMVGDNRTGVAVYNAQFAAAMLAIPGSGYSNVWGELPPAPFAIGHMVGSNPTDMMAPGAQGLAVCNGTQFAVLKNYSAKAWQNMQPAPFAIQGMVGDNWGGVAIYNGNRFAVMNDYDANKWYSFPNAPFAIQGMVGNNRVGVAIYNGSQFAVMNSYDDRKWYSFPNAPFPIQGMVGENSSGVAIFNGKRFAVMNNYDSRQWIPFPDAPFEIEGMIGNNRTGVAIYNGSQFAVMNSYDDKKWYQFPNAPFPIQGMVGDNHNGVAVYHGNRVAVMDSYDSRTWHEMTPGPFDGNVYPPINNSGFAANYATTNDEDYPASPLHAGDTICCAAEDQVPILTQLAREFALCDNWFSSMPGPTWPNRFFAMGGSSGGLDRTPTTEDKASFDLFGFAYAKGSIFDHLGAKGVPWQLYNDKTNAYAGVPPTIFGSLAIAYFLKNMHRPVSLTQFAADLNRPGGYPYKFTFIEPNYGDAWDSNFKGGSSQHPVDGLDAGERLIHDVYSKIRKSPVWNNSLLIITYDEHGGFYDHVAPPPAPSPGDGLGSGSPLNSFGFNFDQLGVRVPAVIVSPLIKPNTIDHTLYDHTSILSTVESFFGMSNLTDRDKVANRLDHLLTGPLRTDLVELPEPRPVVQVDRPAPTDDDEVLEPTGNHWGFVLLLAKQDFEISDRSDAARDAIRARLAQIRTKGDGRAYGLEVQAKTLAFEQAAGTAPPG